MGCGSVNYFKEYHINGDSGIYRGGYCWYRYAYFLIDLPIGFRVVFGGRENDRPFKIDTILKQSWQRGIRFYDCKNQIS